MDTQKQSKIRAGIEKIIPIDQLFPCFLILAIDLSVYFLSKIFLNPLDHRIVFLEIDDMIPLIPEMVWVYVLAFPYWIISVIVILRTGGLERYRIVTAFILSLLITLVSFTFIRLKIIRPEVEPTGPSTALLNWLYEIDSPTNLFPSLHCVFSYLCFIGIAQKPNVKWFWKVGIFLFMLLVFASTVTLKQHYMVDVVSGILVAMLSVLITTNTNLYKGVFFLSKKFYKIFKIELDDNGNEVIR